MKWMRRGVLVLLALLVFAALAYAFMPKPVRVETARVARGSLSVTIDAQGRTRVRDRFTVAAPLACFVQRISLRAGDSVKAGDVLAEVRAQDAPMLDTRARAQLQAAQGAAEAGQRQAQTRVTAAQAALAFAQWKVEQDRGLRKSGDVSEEVFRASELRLVAAQEDLKSAQFGLQVSDFNVQQARVALLRSAEAPGGEGLIIRSPVSGRVLRLWQESEGAVMAGAPLLELGDPERLEVVVDMLSTDAVRIGYLSPVEIVHWGGDGPLSGKVRVVEPSGFTKVSALGVEEQRVNVIVDFNEPRARYAALGDGYRVETRTQVWRRDNVLKVPGSALFRSGDGFALFVVDQQKAVRREVVVGRRNGLEAEIVEGAAEGQSVIVHPGDAVTDGVAISTP